LACTHLQPNQKLQQTKSLALAHLVIDGTLGEDLGSLRASLIGEGPAQWPIPFFGIDQR
jgi:hypothetical protein